MSNAFPGVKDPSNLGPSPDSSMAAGPISAALRVSTRREALATKRVRTHLLAVLSVLLGIGLLNSPASAHLRAAPARTAVIKTAVVKTGAVKTAVIKTAPIKTAARTVKVKPKSSALLKATKKPTKKPVPKAPKVTKPATATTPSTAPLTPAATEPPTTTPQARVLPTPVVAAVAAGVTATVPQPPASVVTSDAVINPLPAASPTVAPVGAGTGITVPPPVTTTTTTSIPPAPFPAPADPPKRAAAATLDPYRGVGAWVDRLDWSNLFSKNKPAVTLATIDQMAAAGIQTIYIQIPHWQTTPDIYELERLQPLIDRAHALGMYVVGWYLPLLFDVNTDLRKVVAMANLDLDGIQIDIEKTESVAMSSVALRNARLTEFHRSLRSLLPGRVISADIVAPTWMDGQVGRWSWPNYPPATRQLFWGGPFPYAEVVATYDLVALQVYWTQNSANSGWRDSQAFVQENMNRMRAYSGRSDYPIQAIGGVETAKSQLNDLIGYMDAAKAAGSFGFSLYDWTTTPSSWWPAMWGLRSTVDPRFPPPALPAYVPLAQPATPPVTTTTTTKVPATVPAAAVAPTTAPSASTVPPVEIIIK
jgi:hypothetical protein